MSRPLYDLALVGCATAVLTACGATTQVTKPVPVERTVIKVERVPRELTDIRQPVPEGSIAECPVVAARRRALLEACYGSLEAIEQRHGADDE